MKNRKTNSLKITTNNEINDNTSKTTVNSDTKRLEQQRILSTHKVLKNNSYNNNGTLSTKYHPHKRNFSINITKMIQENDLNNTRSISNKNSNLKKFIKEKSTHRNDNFLSSSCIEENKKLYICSKSNLDNSRYYSEKINEEKNIESNVHRRNNSKINCDKSLSAIVSNSKSISTKNTNSFVNRIIDTISITSLLSQDNNIPINLSYLKQHIDHFEPSKHSIKSQKTIRSYSVNTHQGIIRLYFDLYRTYNEDRVTIILNIIKPTSFSGKLWPKCSFFGIYDGHGGSQCANFLRDNLHHYIVKHCNFPDDPVEAIKKGFDICEKEFINKVALNEFGEVLDKSGSCALICIIIGKLVYFANVGDSRAIMSCNGGEQVVQITNDHKPNEENETKRILNYGGKIYQ